MQAIENDAYRNIARSVLEKLNKIYIPITGSSLDMEGLREIIDFVEDHSRNTEKIVKNNMKDALSISSIGLVSIGLLSLSLHPKDNPSELFPDDWLSPSGVNPNLVLSHMLNHLTNYGLAVQVLIEKGLDAQARSQLRLLIELSWLILALVYDRELWIGYVTTDEESESKFWSKNLKSYQLNRLLNDIEQGVGMDDELLETMRSCRKESYAMYSNVVHHSYTSVMLGAMAFSEESDYVTFGVFGEADNASKSTLNHLNYVLWYFSVCFFVIMEKVHGLNPKTPQRDFWFEAFALHNCFKEIYMFEKVRHIYGNTV
ncbi:MAG: hypothetical protein OIF55_00440 [Amphritea sp.]|nr:hypothetical protein [Amphritea sp.]